MRDAPYADFSKTAIQKRVLAETAQKPLVLYPTTIGIVALAAGMAFSAPLVIGGGAVGIVTGVAAWIVDYCFRYDENAASYIEGIRVAQQQYFAEWPARLRESLEAHGSKKGVRQLKELEDSFEDFRTLLASKFSQRGLALGRFLGVAEQVRAGALERLQMIVDHMKAIESIPADLESEVRKQKSAKGESAAHTVVRIGHRKQALATIEEFHADIEASLSHLSDISLRIAKIGAGEEKESEFETYLAEMRRLAEQATSFRKEV